MTRGKGTGNSNNFKMNGPVRDFAYEVAREIAVDLKNPVFQEIVAREDTTQNQKRGNDFIAKDGFHGF